MATNNVLIQKYQGATSGYNQINPLTVDEDLNTRIGFASGSTSKDIVDYNSQFWWKRRSLNKTYGIQETAWDRDNYSSDKDYYDSAGAYIAFYNRYGPNFSLNYSDEYEISSEGIIILKNPSSINITANASINSTIRQTLYGKYIQRITGSYSTTEIPTAIENSICYVPPKSDFGSYEGLYIATSGSSNDQKYLYANKMIFLKAYDNTKYSWEDVFSDQENSYPNWGEYDGYYYISIGNPLKDWKNQCKIDTGTYMGTGAGTIQLAFPFQPKMVVVSPKENNNGEYGSSVLAINLTSKYSQFYLNGGTGGSLYSTAPISLSWMDKTFSATWDFSASSAVKLDNINTEYYYVAFG